jgi:glycosyltransferase involved in cell wall biosynthesis
MHGPTEPTSPRHGMETPTLAEPCHVVVIKSGPVYALSDQLEYQAALLQRLAPGLILTHGPDALETRAGRVLVRCIATRDADSTRLHQAGMMARMVRDAAASIRASGLRGLVVSYDPLRSGLVARTVKAVTGARFICEVNGVYGSPDNYADLPDGAAARHHRRTLGIARAMLRGADGIRLLYDGQLAGWARAPNGAAVRAFFDPVPLARFRDEGEHPYLLFVGHPFRRKGVDVLVRAFARVRDRHPHWRLVLIGHLLDEPVRQLGVDLKRIEVRKPVSNAELAPWIGRCGAFVLPSRSEAMGRVLLEAAAAGKPRIASAVDGIPAVVRDGVDGLLVPREDEAALAATLDRVMSSMQLRAALGNAARERVLADFSADAWLHRFTDLANAVLRPRDPSPQPSGRATVPARR